MELRLTDIEANATKHALERYLANLKEGKQEKGVQFEEKAVMGVIDKIKTQSGASGV